MVIYGQPASIHSPTESEERKGDHYSSVVDMKGLSKKRDQEGDPKFYLDLAYQTNFTFENNKQFMNFCAHFNSEFDYQ